MADKGDAVAIIEKKTISEKQNSNWKARIKYKI